MKQEPKSIMSYCRQRSAKLQQMTADQIGSNILLKGSNGKSIMIFIPKSTNPLPSFPTPARAFVTGAFKNINDSRSKSPVKSYDKSPVRQMPQLNYAPITSTPIDLSTKESKILKFPVDSSPIDLSLNTTVDLPTVQPNAPVNSTVKSPVIFQHKSPVKFQHESPVPSLIKRDRPSTSAAYSGEESFYEFLKKKSTSPDFSIHELPVLPNESQNSPIYIMFNDRVASTTNKEPVVYEMFVGSDATNTENVDSVVLRETLMAFLTVACHWAEDPDFMQFNRDFYDPVFDIIFPYYDNDVDRDDDFDEIPSIADTIEPQNEITITNDDSAIPKRKRKPKVYSDDYYCEGINQTKAKKMKLETSPSVKGKILPVYENLLKNALAPKKSLKQRFEQDIDSYNKNDDLIVLGPNNTKITKKQFDSIKWNSASTSTRKLLSLIFSNEILATHSLTGKPSPAFIGRERPLKQQLNPDIIQDIMCMVHKQTKGTDREIRAAITTKCADTAKLIRTLNKNK